MKVADLIELLRAHPPDRRVVLKAYEEGSADALCLQARPIKLDVPPDWWNGPHESAETEADEVAVEIVRIDREPH